ncbi:MAG TPA: MlaD family protein [Chitinophagaceae bacterium]|nr:MlaD family protein [Chitinophagaceae bacterium]
MKISNETKVGVLTISALTLLIIGFNFLKGKDLFNKSKKIYAVFDDLGSLSKSNDVKINGLVIGKVYSLEATDKNISGIVATINLTHDVNIPRDSKAFISTPLIGGSTLIIEKGTDTVYLKPGDTLKTKVDNGIVDDIKAQLTPTLNKVRNSLDTLNIVLSSIARVLNSEAKNNLQEILANLNQATASVNSLLDGQTGSLAKAIGNMNSITENLKKNNDTITATINNAKHITDKLAKLEIQPVIDSLQSTVKFLKATVAKLSDPNGSIGALITDKKLYNKLNDVILGAEILIDDLRTHPRRYLNFSLIGGKDRGGALTAPLAKDSVPSGNK